MSAHASLIPELEQVVEHRSPERRAETLERITALFLENADRFNEDHVRLFDDVLGRLIGNVPSKARAELSVRLAPVGNAPVAVVRQLAHDDEISIAGPVLVKSRRLDDSDLAGIAKTKSQAHLLAISGRSGIAEPVTGVLVDRGNSAVVRRLVENQSSRLSDASFAKLVEQAEKDAALAEAVALRTDVPPRLLGDLLRKLPKAVRERLLATARPERQAELQRMLADAPTEIDAKPADYATAQQKVEDLRQAGKLDEAALVDLTQQKRQEETVVALASLCAVPIEVVDRLMSSERPDPVLILCKAAGWGWPTVKAIIAARNGGGRASSQALDSAYANFERLSPATAQRVMRFWQVRR
jgi:uncharacterized protein (DUF2336 family)